MGCDMTAIERTIEHHQYSREVCRLADALVYALNIHDGHALVPFLAPLRARNNREAVACWLLHELEKPDVELSQHCIAILLPRLEKALQSVEENMTCGHQ